MYILEFLRVYYTEIFHLSCFVLLKKLLNCAPSSSTSLQFIYLSSIELHIKLSRLISNWHIDIADLNWFLLTVTFTAKIFSQNDSIHNRTRCRFTSLAHFFQRMYYHRTSSNWKLSLHDMRPIWLSFITCDPEVVFDVKCMPNLVMIQFMMPLLLPFQLEEHGWRREKCSHHSAVDGQWTSQVSNFVDSADGSSL